MAIAKLFKMDYTLFAENRQKVLNFFHKENMPQHALLFLEGVKQLTRAETDRDLLARQESKFMYMFGVKEADCYGMVEVDSGKTTLFIPRLDEAWAIWMGNVLPPEHFKELYLVDDCKYSDEIKQYCEAYKPEVIYTTHGQNSDSDLWSQEAHFDGIEDYKVDNSHLYEAIAECRVFKSDKEMDVYRYSGICGAQAHLDMMNHVKPGMYEFQLEALHKYSGYDKFGSRLSSFVGICGSGRNSSILHYGHAGAPNRRQMQDGEWVLCDMGTEYECFASDITTTFPVNGKYTPEQKDIYNVVLEMNRSCQKMAKPGVSWVDVHLNANRVGLEGLKKIGIVHGDIEEMMKVNLAAYFMPHGLGHFMGLDVHDVGGYLHCDERSPLLGLKSLRTRRVLEHRMLITVEPGIYFIDVLIKKLKADPELAKFVDFEVLEKKYYPIGGCRIECDCFITENGCEDITPAPRTIEDIEAACAGKITSVDQIKSFVN
ncbi:hypothetical protein WA158_008008 [Blastocystis sp. Blastoise]